MELPVHALTEMYPGPPDAGNLHVRWDEGEGRRPSACSLPTLLVKDFFLSTA
jgi:hypothetical protein